MARGIVQRRARWYDIPSFRGGLVTDTDYLMADPRGAHLLQNARTRTGRIVKRNGTRYYSPSLGSGSVARIAGLHQWYPATRTESNLCYAVSAGVIYRLPWTPMSVSPPTTAQAVTIADGAEFGISEFAHFVDFNDYCFVFNGLKDAVQLRLDDPNSAYTFQLAKANTPTAEASLTGGSIAAGTYSYRIRFVREREERVREYYGQHSDAVDITTTGATSSVVLTLPTVYPADATHIYIERTLTDLKTYYYLARVAVGTATYTDTAASPSTEIDDETLRIENIHYACVDDGSLFAVYKDATTGSWFWANSQDGRPQEFGVFNNGEIAEGSGDVTGCVAFGGRVFVFREKGIIVYAKNSAYTYDRVEFWPGWGCVAPWSCRVIRDGNNNFVAFFDDSEGPCLLTGSRVETLKRRKRSDCVQFIDSGEYRDKLYTRYVSVGYKRGYIYWSYANVGSTYNNRCLVYDSAQDVWFGPDTGYSCGPMFTRLTGYGVYGSGELLAALDADTVYVQELDAPYSRDLTDSGYIVLDVRSMALGSDALAAELEFQQIAYLARLTSIFRMDLSVNGGKAYTGSVYTAPSARYAYDDGTLFDGGATFDECIQSLFDTGVFDRTTDVFDTAADMPYQVEIDSMACQGAYLTINLYDAYGYYFEISRLRVLAVDRGERT